MITRDNLTEENETFALILENANSYRTINLGTGRILGTITDNN